MDYHRCGILLLHHRDIVFADERPGVEVLVNLRKAIITARFSFLHEYAQEKNLSKDLLEKITNNLEFLEESNLFMDYQNPTSFMNDLSLDLTFKLAKSVYSKMIEKILFFQENDLNFISKLIPFITWRKFKKGENIYRVQVTRKTSSPHSSTSFSTERWAFLRGSTNSSEST